MSTIRPFLAGLLWLLTLGPAYAGVQVSPTGLFLEKSQRVSVLTLTNRDKQAVEYQVQAYRWDQVNGEEGLELTRDLLISPPIFAIEPGATQTIRVAVRRAFPTEQEASYRIILRELPDTDQQGETMALQMALAISLPVFLAPEGGAAEADIHWQATLDHNTQTVSLVGENQGDRHFKLTQLALSDGDGKALTPPKQTLVYLLPGTKREWRFQLDSVIEPEMTVNVRTVSGRQSFSASIPLD